MTRPQLSVQLYSVREKLDAQLDDTLGRLHALGLRNVEAYGFVDRAPELRAAFDRAGLVSPTGHAHFLSDELRFGEHVVEVPPFEKVLDAAETLGITFLIDPMVAADRWQDATEVARTAERLNRAAGLAAERGIRVGYHNHSQEFHATIDGVTAFEHFVSLLDPAVGIELDTYWAAISGVDVIALLGRLGDRVRAVHVKDGARIADPFRSSEPRLPGALAQQPAGRGELPVAEIVAASGAADYAVIEFDEYEGDLFEGIAESVRFLAEQGIR